MWCYHPWVGVTDYCGKFLNCSTHNFGILKGSGGLTLTLAEKVSICITCIKFNFRDHTSKGKDW